MRREVAPGAHCLVDVDDGGPGVALDHDARHSASLVNHVEDVDVRNRFVRDWQLKRVAVKCQCAEGFKQQRTARWTLALALELHA